MSLVCKVKMVCKTIVVICIETPLNNSLYYGVKSLRELHYHMKINNKLHFSGEFYGDHKF